MNVWSLEHVDSEHHSKIPIRLKFTTLLTNKELSSKYIHVVIMYCLNLGELTKPLAVRFSVVTNQSQKLYINLHQGRI